MFLQFGIVILKTIKKIYTSKTTDGLGNKCCTIVLYKDCIMGFIKKR